MEYIHNVKYYETDKMGITHHSNYVRWMEEARVNYLNSIGCNYRKLEEEGVISPVIGVNLSYKNTTTFDDLVTIKIKVLEYSGIKLKFSYEMVKEDGKVACIAESDHCFLNALGRPINMKREKPLLHEILLKELENNK